MEIRRHTQGNRLQKPPRTGAGTLEYFLGLMMATPLAFMSMWALSKIARLVYEMTCVLVAWPMM